MRLLLLGMALIMLDARYAVGGDLPARHLEHRTTPGAHSGAAISSRLYPVCNVKCWDLSNPDQQRNECKINTDDFSDVAKLVRADTGFRDTAVPHFNAGLVVVVTTRAGHQVLEQNWTSFACPTQSSPLRPDDGRNFSLCLANAKRWLKLLRRDETKLASDGEFLRICLNVGS